MTDMTQLPVACTLSEPDLAKRRAGLFTDLAQHRQEARWLPEGIALRYSSEQGSLARKSRVPGGPIWLELTGPPGTRDFLANEIGDPGIA